MLSFSAFLLNRTVVTDITNEHTVKENIQEGIGMQRFEYQAESAPDRKSKYSGKIIFQGIQFLNMGIILNIMHMHMNLHC